MDRGSTSLLLLLILSEIEAIRPVDLVVFLCRLAYLSIHLAHLILGCRLRGAATGWVQGWEITEGFGFRAVCSACRGTQRFKDRELDDGGGCWDWGCVLCSQVHGATITCVLGVRAWWELRDGGTQLKKPCPNLSVSV